MLLIGSSGLHGIVAQIEEVTCTRRSNVNVRADRSSISISFDQIGSAFPVHIHRRGSLMNTRTSKLFSYAEYILPYAVTLESESCYLFNECPIACSLAFLFLTKYRADFDITRKIWFSILAFPSLARPSNFPMPETVRQNAHENILCCMDV